jgi:nucleoside-diphosphate-sugar epimerase
MGCETAAVSALVTGGGGFLGGAIVRQLVARGDRVWSFSRGAYPELADLGVETLRGDLGDRAAVDAAIASAAGAGCETVYHVAAKAGAWGPLSSYRSTNIDGTAHVIAACRHHGIGRLVYTSSPSVVLSGSDVEGGDESLPYPDRWLAHYPATKAEAEQLILAANDDQLATVCLRPHLIWGPGDTHLLPRLVDRARRGRLRRIGDGHNLIDTVYIDDAARAHLLAGERLGSVAGRTYFISAGEPIAAWTMVDQLLAAAGEGPVTKVISARAARCVGAVLETVWRGLRLAGEPPMTRWVAVELSTSHWFDISAARRDLDYEPQVTLEDGMERLRQWCASPTRSRTPRDC